MSTATMFITLCVLLLVLGLEVQVTQMKKSIDILVGKHPKG
jgi:hypothetical protein